MIWLYKCAMFGLFAKGYPSTVGDTLHLAGKPNSDELQLQRFRVGDTLHLAGKPNLIELMHSLD